MEISKDQLKSLRDATGVSFMQCRKALEEANGDMDQALVILKKMSGKAASKKADRTLGSGIIDSYIHSNNSVGVLLEMQCETDFVARNEDFLALSKDVAMHIAAMNPEFASLEDIPTEVKDEVTAELKAEIDAMDKPDDIKATILEGKVAGHFADRVLTEQPFVKNPDMTVGKLIEEAIQKIGEKIAVGRYVRYTVSK